MLTDLEKTAFKIHSAVFCYSSPIPLKWDPEFTRLELLHPKWKWLPWCCSCSVAALYCFLFCPLAILLKMVVFPDPDFFPVNASVIAIFGAVGMAGVAIIDCLKHDSVGLYNNNFDLLADLLAEGRAENVDGLNLDQDKFGQMLCLLMPTVGVSPLVITIAVFATDYDALHHVLECLLLPPPEYRELRHLSLEILARAGTVYVAWEVGIKTLAFVMVYVIVTVRATGQAINVMGIQAPAQFHHWYSLGRVGFAQVERSATQVTYIGLFTIFWTLVTTFWMVLCGPEKLHPAAYAFVIIIFTNLLLLHVIFLPPVCRSLERLVSIVEDKGREAEAAHIQRKSRRSKATLLEIKAMRAIRVKYGSFWWMGKDFIVEYVEAAVSRSVDVIMVFGI